MVCRVFLSYCPLLKIENLSVLFGFPGNMRVKAEYQIKKSSFAGMKELKAVLAETTTYLDCVELLHFIFEIQCPKNGVMGREELR